jgi:membrane protease subunit (stomatin/prohibitin family)
MKFPSSEVHRSTVCPPPGDVIELVGSSDTGLLEGVLRGATGLFTRDIVQVNTGQLEGARWGAADPVTHTPSQVYHSCSS